MNPISSPSRIARGAFITLLLLPQPAFSAFEFAPTSARSGGTGDNYVAWAQGTDALIWNPGAIVWHGGIEVTAVYDRPFGVRELQTGMVGMLLPLRNTALGFRFEDFGFALFREQTMGVTVGHRVRKRLGLGLTLRSLRLSAEGVGSRSWVVFDLGTRVVFPGGVRFGMAAWNVGGTSMSLLGQGGMAGIGIEVSPGVFVLVDVRKESGLPAGGGAGIEFEMGKRTKLRLGVGNQPERFSGGFGVRKGYFTIDYSAAYHSILGVSHRVSLTIGR